MLLREINVADGQPNEAPATRAVVLGELESAAPILNYAQFYQIQGNGDVVNTVTELNSAGENRAVNSDFASKSRTATGEITVALRILGDVIETDQALARRGFTEEGARMRSIRSFARSIGRHFTDQLINGDNTGQNMNGIKAQATNIVYTGTDGLDITASDANKEAFLEYLDETIELVSGGAEVLIMDGQLIGKLKSIGRAYVQTTLVRDIFGREQQVDSYGGVPIIRAGYAKDKTTRVLPFTETRGASTDCGSIYAVRFGEREALSIATSNGLNVKDYGLIGNFYTARVEFDANVLLEDANAVVRLAGVRI